MSEPLTNQLLSVLLATVGKSFPQYLQYSRPYYPPGRESVREAIDAIVSDQNGIVDRVSQMLIDADYPPRAGEFPMEYTDKHDLSIDYLLLAAVGYQQQDIAAIADLAEALRMAPAAKSLAEEALGMAKGHLDTLEELAAAPVAG